MPLRSETVELGARGAAFHVEAKRTGPEGRAEACGHECHSTKPPTSPSPAVTTAAHGGLGGGGRAFWPFLWEESPSKTVPARTQDFHFNAPWQAALPRNLLKAHGKAFKNTLITNNSSASPDFPPRGAGGGAGWAQMGRGH